MTETLVYLPGLSCMVLVNDWFGPCGADAVFLLINEKGQYTPVCQWHIATDKEGRILPAVKRFVS